MVADYIQAQLKMSEVQLLYAKKSLRHWNSTLNTSSPSDSPPLSFPRQQQLDRHGTGDTDVSETNLALKRESFCRLEAQKGHLDLTTTTCSPMNARPLHFANRSNPFTLFPSKDNSTTAAAKENYNTREIIAQAAANATQQTLPPESTKGTTLVLAKPFEYFPTPSGDHSLCYFDLKNNSLRPVAYKVTTNRPELYEIAPDGAWIPPGRTWSISVKYAGKLMDKESLQNDRIIVTTFSQLRFSGQNPIDEFLRLENLTPSSSATFPVKDFVIHPCSVLPQRYKNINVPAFEVPLVDNEAIKWNYSNDVRLERLRNRNDAERLFDYMQDEAAASIEKLKKIQRRSSRLGSLFSVLSYVMFVGTLGLAVYLSMHEERLKREAQARRPSYCENYLMLRWIWNGGSFAYTITETVIQTAFHCTWTGYNFFLLRPLVFMFDWLLRGSPGAAT